MLIGVAKATFPAWHAHADAWAILGVIELAYLYAVYRSPSRQPTSARQVALFSAGVAVMAIASDWPVHDLAERYLYSVHMVQHLMLTLGAAPLLLLGTPAWLARRILGLSGPSSGIKSPTWLLRPVRAIARPIPGLIQFNIIIVLSHWPAVVDLTVRHHPLHFFAHAILLASALLMWLPVLSPLPEVPRAKPLTQMLYLFLQTVVPTIPASFLTFGKTPLYRIYETFPRLWGISALTDQMMAGLIMKLGAGLFFWTVIAVIFFRWYDREDKAEKRARESGRPPATARGDVLLWEDVEKELKQLDRGS